MRSGASLQQAAADWLETYQGPATSAALAALVQLLVSAAGSSAEVTPEMVEELEMQELVAGVTAEEHLQEQAAAQGAEGRKLRASIGELLGHLVAVTSNSALYDGRMMDVLVGLATAMSGCATRPVRHAGALAAMEVMTALAGVRRREGERQANAARQLEAEERKNARVKAADRLEVLRTKVAEAKENLDELGHIMDHLYTRVFVLRCKDVAPEVRALCLEHLGRWVAELPARFLEDSCLKYLGWFLNDAEAQVVTLVMILISFCWSTVNLCSILPPPLPQVRLTCLRALRPLYAAPEHWESLELFTTQFKARLVTMALDVDTDVATEAVQLLVALTAQDPEVLEDESKEEIYMLCYSRVRRVAQAAAVFLQQSLVARGDYTALPATSSRRGKHRRAASFLLRDIVTFSAEVELAGHEAFLVDSLAACCPALRDWEALVDLLVEAPGRGEEALAMEEEEQRAAALLLVESVRRTVEGQPPAGRGGHRRLLTAREQEAARTGMEEATACLLPALPRLLGMFADPELLARLLDLLQWLDLDLYTVGRLEAALDALLWKARELAEQQEHPALLASVSRGLELLCSPGRATQARCEPAAGHLLDALVTQYRASMEDFSSKPSGADMSCQEVDSLTTSLAKLAAFYPRHDLSRYNLWSSLLDITGWREEGEGEAVAAAVSCCHHSLLWQVLGLRAGTRHHRPAEVRRRLEEFLASCGRLLAAGRAGAEQAAAATCALLLTAPGTGEAPTLAATRKQVEPLVIFLEERVLEEEEGEDFATLCRKRELVGAFCRLVHHRVVPARCFAFLLRRLLSHQERFGDIIQACLDHLRDEDRVLCGRVMVEALVEGLAGLAVVDRADREFAGLRELARRLALCLGVEVRRNREAVEGLHRAGIEAAAGRAGAPLLELLREFAGRLAVQDRQVGEEFLWQSMF